MMSLKRVIDGYLCVLLLLAGFTSIVLIPSVSASVPSYLLIYLFAPLLIIYSISKREFFHKELLAIILVFVLINVLAQLNVYYSKVQFTPGLLLVKPDHPEKTLLRSSMFTQSAYLFAGILLCLYLKYFGTRRHMEYFYWGLRILVIYGFLEVLLYQLTGVNGDFISNRQFDNSPGSAFQTMQLGSISVQRLKSLTGEPSMFALTVVPFWILAIGRRAIIDSILLGVALILSFSTSAWLGMLLLAVAVALYEKKIQRYLLWIIPMAVVVLIAAYFTSSGFERFINDSFLNKLHGSNQSGRERTQFFTEHMHFWWYQLNFVGKFTGMGFGYVRSTDFFSTLLVNNGIIGLVIFTRLFIKSARARLRGSKEEKFYYCIGLLATYLIMMISVPEFAYLSIWILLAYPPVTQNSNLFNKPSLRL